MSPRGNCYDCESVKSEVAERFDSSGDAKMELFDCIEVPYNEPTFDAWPD